MRKIFKNINYVWLFISLMIFSLTFFGDNQVFGNISKYYLNINYIIPKLLVLIAFIFSGQKLGYIIQKIIDKDKIWIKKVITFLIFFGILVVIFLAISPGITIWDSYFVYESATKLEFLYWQNYLSVIIHLFSLMILPFPTGINIIMILIISLISTYVISDIREKNNYSKLSLIIWLPFFIIPVFTYNFSTLRVTLAIYLLLLLIYKIYKILKEADLFNYFNIIFISILLGFISVLRNDFLSFLVLIPIVFILLLLKKVALKKVVLFIIISFGVFFLLNIPQKNGMKEQYGYNYEILTMINPLSNLLNTDLKSNNLEKDLNNINAVVNIDVLKKYPSYTETPSYWQSVEPLIRENITATKMRDFKKSYLNILLFNTKDFVKYRFKTFAVTTGMDRNYLPVINYEGKPENINRTAMELFVKKNESKPLFGPKIKNLIIKYLIGNGIDISANNNSITKILWNQAPIFILMILGTIIALFRKQLIYLAIYFMLFFNIFGIFITAPASYAMYYTPVILSGTIISAIYILELITDLKNHKKDQKLSKTTWNQAYYFILISGIGFIIDFICYTIFSSIIGIPIYLSNILSAIPSVTFVFLFSTSKLFKTKKSGLDIKKKYLIYLIYQFVLLLIVSFFAQFLYNIIISNIGDILINLKIVVKILITPITMCCNFMVMKFLSEKL